MVYKIAYSLNKDQEGYSFYYFLEKICIKFTSKEIIEKGDSVEVEFKDKEIILKKSKQETKKYLTLVSTIFPLDSSEDYTFYSKNKDVTLHDIYKSEDKYGNAKYLMLISGEVNKETSFDFICSTCINSSMKFFVNGREENQNRY